MKQVWRMSDYSLPPIDDDLDFTYLEKKYPHKLVVTPELLEVCENLIDHAEIPLFIHGETGTGKGMLAQHIANRRNAKHPTPFVSVNCALLNSELAESIIFGHKKGAFTGATEQSNGCIGAADGGILFLDEVHCLSLATQKKLLRLLDAGFYTRVGDIKEQRSSFQLIAASNRDLRELVQQGAFLLDLLMRMQGFEIHLKPLRERDDEMEDLVAWSLKSRNVSIKASAFTRLCEKCRSLYWQGNVRQLFKSLDAAVFRAKILRTELDADLMEVDDLMQRPGSLHAEPSRSDLIDKAISEMIKVRNRPIDLEYVLEEIEQSIISYCLEKSHSIFEAMQHLNLSRGKLDFKRRKYNLIGRV